MYVPALKNAHWVNIKGYLKDHPHNSVIRFHTSEANRFNQTTFAKLFISTVLHEVPYLSLAEALNLFGSNKPDESYLGLIVLFRRYPNVQEIWNCFIQRLAEKPLSMIPPVLVYYLAHIPWHGDIAYLGERITRETTAHAKNLLAKLSREQVVKLLSFIDEESSISRGTIGQSVEAIISSLPNATEFLQSIILDNSLPVFTRECASIILAMNKGKFAIATIAPLAGTGSWYAGELIEHLNTYGGFDPYL